MAGSLGHILGGWSLVENMGDAYETCEELLWLVLNEIGEEKAKKLIMEKYYPMSNGKIEKNDSFLKVKELMDK